MHPLALHASMPLQHKLLARCPPGVCFKDCRRDNSYGSNTHVDDGNNVTRAEPAKLPVGFAQSTMTTADISFGLAVRTLDPDDILKQDATSTGTIIIMLVNNIPSAEIGSLLGSGRSLLKDRVLGGQVLPHDFTVAQGAGKIDTHQLLVLHSVQARMSTVLDAGLKGHGRPKLGRLGAEDDIDTVAMLDTAPEVRGTHKIYQQARKQITRGEQPRQKVRQ